MNWQTGLLAALILVSVVWILVRAHIRSKNGGCGCGCDSCKNAGCKQAGNR